MTTLVFVITELDRGGAEQALLRLVEGLDRDRFRPRAVISLSGPGDLGGQFDAAGVTVIPLRMRSRPVAAFLDLVLAIRDLRPDILQTFLFHANVLGRLAGAVAGVRCILSSVRVTETDRPWRGAVERMTQAPARKVTCVSEAVRCHVRRTAGIPESKLIVIPNGVQRRAVTRRDRLSFRYRILTVAHLRRQKGIDVLIRAVPGVLREIPSATFTVVGGGDPSRCLAMARTLGVDRSIRLIGPVADVGPFWSEADVFVLPSRWEGCPNAVLEAMAAGLPVVATAVGGTPELVVDGETGVLVPPESPSALARAIAGLLRDPDRALAMGASGQARAATEFPMSRMVKSYEALYASCLPGSGPPPASA